VRGLVVEDVAALERLPLVEAVAPLLVLDVSVRSGERTADARVVGTTRAYPHVASFKVRKGRFLDEEDERSRAAVAVLGAKVAQELMPFRDPLGATVMMGGQAFRVIGVMEDRREASSRVSVLATADLGRDVYVPAATATARLPQPPDEPVVDEIALRVQASAQPSRGAAVRVAAGLVRDALLRRHQGVRDFEVVVPEELLRQSQRSQRIFNVVMGAIASISLVVGGIGIMNVMLVTVVQRTREIGIRRAVGATKKDIRDQFLVEALSIAILGGLVGALLGALLAAIISSFAGWVTIVSLKAVVVAFLVAGATGVTFGLVPAVKAAAVDPIECLRHE
jgi:putative ABC transport system permease protein